MARPQIEIDLDELAKLCRLNCTLEEIAAFFGCHKRTIARRMEDDEEFARIVEDGRANGRLSVRREQMKIMESGNATMAIWLGKQLLGQRDYRDEPKESQPVQITVNAPNGD